MSSVDLDSEEHRLCSETIASRDAELRRLKTKLAHARVTAHLDAERDRLAAELAEAEKRASAWAGRVMRLEAQLALDSPVAKAAREWERLGDAYTHSSRRCQEAREALLDLCRAQAGDTK